MSGNTKACGRISPDTVGFWADMEHPYVTYDDNYIESEWWALKTDLGKEACCTKASRSFLTARAAVLRCPAQEVAQGYKDVKERSAIVRFKVKGRRCLHSGMDNHTVDTAVQRGTLREPG